MRNDTIRLRDVIFEDMQDYKKTGMMLATCFCNWKCLREKNLDIKICQNYQIANQKIIFSNIDALIQKYLDNPLTNCIIFAGLEPMLQFDEMIDFIDKFRIYYKCNDDIIIYTGYYPYEITSNIINLKQYKNIVIKFGRFQIDSEKRFDEVLGVYLNSSNQYAERIS